MADPLTDADLVRSVLKERDAWRKLARARGSILVAYRIGSRTPGKAIDDARAAEATLAKLGVEL
jgi:hypothetical protein